MKASKLRVGHIVCPFATLIALTKVEQDENGVVHLTGREIRSGQGVVVKTYPVHPDSEIALCTWEGTEKEGKSKAEIQAEDYYRRLRRAGVEALMTIEEEATRTIVTLTIKAKTVYDDSHTAMWFTWKVGRKTTQFRAFVTRGVLRGRKRSTAKLTRQQFYQAVSDACWMHEYEMQLAYEAATA